MNIVRDAWNGSSRTITEVQHKHSTDTFAAYHKDISDREGQEAKPLDILLVVNMFPPLRQQAAVRSLRTRT